MRADAEAAPFVCPGCGETRLLEGDRRAWACRVCGQHGPRRLRLTPDPAADPRLAVLAAVGAAIGAQLRGPGTWQVGAIAPLAQWPAALRRELTRTLGAAPDTVILVLERVPE
jgi:hypothetical protein